MNRKMTKLAVAVGMLAGALSAQAADKELQVWIRATNDSRAVYDRVAQAFEKKTGIHVEYFNTLTDFEQRLARAAAGNTLPDLMFNDATFIGQGVQMGILDQIDPKSIKGGDDIFPAAWESAKSYDGKFYAVPTSAQSFALFVRKDWRIKLGLPTPQTWKDVQNLAKAFTEKDPDGNGKNDTFGFIVPASTTRGYTSWFLSSFIWQAGGDFLKPVGNAYKSNMATKETVEAVDFLRGMMCAKVTQPGAINATTADAIPSFRSGQTGMFFTGPYHLPLMDKDPGKGTYEVVSIKGPKSAATLAEGTSVYLMKKSQNKAAAKQFIEFMVSPEGQEMGMKAGENQPIVRLSVNKKVNVKQTYDNDARWQLFQDLYAKEGKYVPRVPNWTPIRQATSDGLNKIMANCSSDIMAGLKDVDVAVNAELAKQNVLAK
ncbi:MAG: sugar ABC transporter substrate-binding protein [Rhodocyclaceae bacterium]